MKRQLITLVALLGIALWGRADGWTPKTLPMVHLEDSTRYVCNPDGVLADSTCEKIDNIMRVLKNKKGIESVIIAVKKIEGGDPYTFCMELGNSYGVGDKELNTGLIVLLSTEDRAYQILTGRGLEGTLPDVACYNIEQDYMIPSLKKGDWNSAMLNCAKAIGAEILQDPSLGPSSPTSDDGWAGTIANLCIIGGLVWIGVAINRQRKKCPKCGKRKIKTTERTQVKKAQLSETVRLTYLCKRCGHQYQEEKTFRYRKPGSGRSSYNSGGGRSSGGGGSSRGGSFGGGSFGGGGAGGRF